MNRFFYSMIIVCLVTSMSYGQFAVERGSDQGKAAEGLIQMQRDLLEARDIVKRLPASPNRDRLELLLTRTELSLKQLGSGNMSGRPIPVKPDEFNRLSQSMRNQAFDKDKYQFLETAMNGRFLTCNQAAQLLKHFSFDSDRIRGAVLLYPQLVDQNNIHQVLEAFAFESSRKTVLERVKGK